MHRRHRLTRRGASCAALVATLLTLAAPASAQTVGAPRHGDPLATADCQSALASLSTQEAAPATPASSSGALVTARRAVAVACLASHADPAAPPPPLMRPSPVDVAPLVVAPASAPPTVMGVRAAPIAPVAPPVDRPYAIRSCDAGGCWANDGSHLNRVGPNLWGPRGICAVQGTLVQCP